MQEDASIQKLAAVIIDIKRLGIDQRCKSTNIIIQP